MKVLVAALVAAVLGAAVVLAPTAYALIVPALLSLVVIALALLWVATGEPFDQAMTRWTYGSYIVHLSLSLAIGVSNLTVAFFGPDAIGYHSEAVKLARHWSEGTPRPTLPFGKEGFYIALGRLYELVGPYRVAGLALTSLCSALLVPLVADSTRRLFGTRAARAVLPLTVLLPGILVWTSQLLREAPILVALALGGNIAIRLSERVSPGRFASLGLTAGVLFTLRANIAYVFAAGLFVGLVLSGRHLMAGIATAVVTLGLVALIVVGGGLGERGYDYAATADLAQVSKLRTDLANTAASGIDHDVDVSTTSGSLAYLPRGVPQFLLGPFPWQIRNLKQLLGLVDAIILWSLVPAFVRGLRRGAGYAGRRIALLIAPATGITIVLSLLIGNIGTIVRERLQVLVFLLPLVALGWVKMEDEVHAVTPDPGALDVSAETVSAR